MSEPNQYDELREQFRKQLKGPFSEIYFSEEELISLFDTAGDSNDDYIRQEVLMVGARLYPDSDALLARRGIFYNQTDSTAFSSFMEDHEADNSGLFRLLKTENFNGTPSQALEIIEEMFNTGNFDDDEFVIQFVQGAHRLELDRWLTDNFQKIYDRVTYKPTLLYEIGIVAQESPELRPLAIRCLEQLTETDPFTADFWSLLAYHYLLADEREKSNSAIEYALALDPHNTEALKGRLRLADPEKDPETVTDVLLKILDAEHEPELSDTALVLARNMNRNDLVHRFLDAIPQQLTPSLTAVTSAVVSDYPRLAELLVRAIFGGGAAEEDWRSLLEAAHFTGNDETYELIKHIYSEYTGTTLEHEYLEFIRLWEKKNYEAAIELFSNANTLGTLRLAEHFFEGMILYVTMLLRTGRVSDAAQIAESLAEAIDSEAPLPGSKIERVGARSIISNIIRLGAMDVPVEFWESFDPFDIPPADPR